MMKRRKIAAAILCLLVFRLAAQTEEEKMMLLKVRYIAVEGTDVEYGQGAIERNELEHSVLGPADWLIRVAPPADSLQWNARLDASVDPKHGRFHVERPTDEELRRVESGEITFQQ